MKKKRKCLTLSRKHSLSLVLASSISTSKKTTAFLAFLAGLRLTGVGAGNGATTAAPFAIFLLPVASSARVSMSTVLLLCLVYSLLLHTLPLGTRQRSQLPIQNPRQNHRGEKQHSAVEINLSLLCSPCPSLHSLTLPPSLALSHSFTSGALLYLTASRPLERGHMPHVCAQLHTQECPVSPWQTVYNISQGKLYFKAAVTWF